MADSFIIVISIILIIQLITLSSFAHFRPVLKAGNVSKFYWKYKLLFGKRPKAILCDNVRVDVSSYETLYVYGNSMKDYHIYNGQEVFVDKLNERQKETISDYLGYNKSAVCCSSKENLLNWNISLKRSNHNGYFALMY